MTKFCKKARQMFFFLLKAEIRGKMVIPKVDFSSFFCFFHFFIQHKNRKFDVDTVSQVILLHLRVLCIQFKGEKLVKIILNIKFIGYSLVSGISNGTQNYLTKIEILMKNFDFQFCEKI